MKPRQVTLKIWTQAYTPFMMGGDVHAPIGCEATGIRITLGKGFHGVAIFTPLGKTVIAEETTGGIVGQTAEQVRQDIAEGDIEAIKKQILDAKAMLSRVRWLDPDDFWKRYENRSTQ